MAVVSPMKSAAYSRRGQPEKFGYMGLRHSPGQAANRRQLFFGNTGPASFGDRVSRIFGGRAGAEMNRIATSRAIARVKDDVPFWNGPPVGEFPSNTMRPLTADEAVAVFIEDGTPRPTFIDAADSDSCPKSLGGADSPESFLFGANQCSQMAHRCSNASAEELGFSSACSVTFRPCAGFTPRAQSVGARGRAGEPRASGGDAAVATAFQGVG